MTKYILSSINLYGVLPINDLLDIINHYSNTLITKNQLVKQINKLTTNINYDISYVDNTLYSKDFDPSLTDDLVEANLILLESANLPYYLPKKEIFLKYSDEFYIEETKSLNNLVSFILKNNIYKENYQNELIKLFNNYFTKTGDSFEFNEYLNYLNQIGFKFNDDNIKEFKNLLELLKYDIRLYSNKANTILELIQLNLANDLVDTFILESLITLLKTRESVSIDDLLNLNNDYTITSIDIKLLINFINNNKDINILFKDNLFKNKSLI